MTALKRNLGAAVIAAAALFLTCEKLPEDCGDKFINDDQFCYRDVSYYKCGGGKYNPDGQFCDDKSSLVYEKCGGKKYDPLAEMCENNKIVTITDFTMTVEANPSDGGTVTGSGNYAIGSDVTVTAANKDGYEFVGWKVTSGAAPAGVNNSTASSLTFEMPNNNLTLAANFEPVYKLTVSTSPSGVGAEITVNGALNPREVSLAAGKQVNVKASIVDIVADESKFTKWTAAPGTLPSGVDTNSANITFNMPANHLALVAHFTRTYRLSVAPAAYQHEWGTVSEGGPHAAGEPVTVSASAKDGYAFVEWTVDPSGPLPNGVDKNDSAISFTMPGNDLYLRAKFAKLYTLDVSPLIPDRGATDPSGESKRAEGASVTVTASANNDFAFQEWVDVDGTLPTSANKNSAVMTFNMPGENVTLKANFTTSNTTPTKPATPTGVAAVEISANGITVSWGTVSGAHGYIICRTTNLGLVPWKDIDTLNSSTAVSYTDDGLDEGTKYYYRVRAFNGTEDSYLSDIVEATTLTSSGALPAPANVTAVAASATSITVSWNVVTGATGYKVFRSLSATGPFTDRITLNSSTVTSYTDPGLTPGTTYYYKVSAFNDMGEGAQSSAVSATP